MNSFTPASFTYADELRDYIASSLRAEAGLMENNAALEDTKGAGRPELANTLRAFANKFRLMADDIIAIPCDREVVLRLERNLNEARATVQADSILLDQDKRRIQELENHLENDEIVIHELEGERAHRIVGPDFPQYRDDHDLLGL